MGKFGWRKCSFDVLVKNDNGSWVKNRTTGVYYSEGVIRANPDGSKPYEIDGQLRYEQHEQHEQQPKRPAHGIIETVQFYCSEYAESFEKGGPEPGDFVAFNVKCGSCSSSNEFARLPPLATLETFADFEKRQQKKASHEEVLRAKAALTDARNLMAMKQEHDAATLKNLAKAQEELAKAQEKQTNARKRLATAENDVTKMLESLASVEKNFSDFDANIVLVEDDEPPRKKPRY